MSSLHRIFVLAVIVVVPISVGADESVVQPAEDKQKTVVAVEQIESWIADLTSPRVSKRQKARQEIVKAGQAGIPSLVVAANSDDGDLSEKAIGILGVLLQSKDVDTKDAALAALEMLTESAGKNVAARAQTTLNSSRVPGVKPKMIPGQAGGEKQFSRVSVSVVNGSKRIEVEENELSVTILDDPTNGIEMEITKDDKVTKVSALDKKDLEKKNPEAFKLFEKYSNGNRIQRPFRRFGGGNVSVSSSFSSSFTTNSNNGNFQFNANGKLPADANQGDAVKTMIDQLRELQKRVEDNEQLKALLEAQINELEKQQID